MPREGSDPRKSSPTARPASRDCVPFPAEDRGIGGHGSVGIAPYFHHCREIPEDLGSWNSARRGGMVLSAGSDAGMMSP